MSVFEPATVQALCASAVALDKKQRTAFLTEWNSNVQDRWGTWRDNRKNQSQYLPQLEWEAHVCEYVSFLAKQARPPKTAAPGSRKSLDTKIPLWGPRFEPPSFLHVQKRSVSPEILPDQTYLKPLNVVHPFYYPELAKCPYCESNDVYWNGWSGTGHREVHGITREETAIGFQLKCKSCEEKAREQRISKPDKGKDDVQPYSALTTNHVFWEKTEQWDIPLGVPHFLKRCAVTSELFDLIVELRPSSTAAGLAENIKQLHLLEYHRNRLAYLRCYHARVQQRTVMPHKAGLRNFSVPMKSGKHLIGFDNTSITDDLITDLFNKYCERTRQKESEDCLRVKGAVAISLDATFRTAAKATIVDNSNGRTRSYKGGIESVLNEKNLIIAWRFCHTQGNSEVEELLSGLKRRFDLLGIAYPEMATVDNCCHVKAAIQKVFPDISICLDVWHFMMRYMICIISGMKNPARQAVARDIVDAILKSRANGSSPAVYWSQPEQERRLVAAYNKWVAKGNVWSAAAEKTHAEQLSHVKKGCLARPRSDVHSDGSRIESSHKGWNGLQRSFASGLESLTALCHDFVLRRNLRVEFATESDASPFVQATHGSHHVRLVDQCARLWNTILDATQAKGQALPADIKRLPVLEPMNSGETFGLTAMGLPTAAHHALVLLKEEPAEDDLLDLASQDLLNAQRILSDIGIDPALAYQLPQYATAPVPPAAPTRTESATSLAGVNTTASVESANTSGATPGHTSDPSASGLAAGLGHLSIAQQRPLPYNQPIDIDAVDDRQFTPRPFAGLSPTHIKAEDSTTTQVLAQTSSRKRRAVEEAADIISISDDELEFSGAPGKSASMGPEVIASSDPADRAHPSPKKKSRISIPGMPRAESIWRGLGPAHARLNSTASPQAAQQPNAVSASSSSASMQPASGRITQYFAASPGSGTHTLSPPPTTVRPSLPSPTISGMTRSQRIFSIATGIDPRSLSFTRAGGDSDEYFLFMRLRKEQQWASFRMTPFDWVCAASLYNTELQRLNRERGKNLITKTPRALMEKLGEVEPDILGRLATGNYASRTQKDSPFWREHCHAVPLGNKTQSGSEVNGKRQKLRKNHVCGRCKVIKYPGPEGSDLNHKKLYCQDGVRQASQKVTKLIGDQPVNVVEEPPPFPQPQGIFTAGTHFHPARFITAVQELYERTVVARTPSGASAMQDLAFAALLRERVQVVPATDSSPSMVLFKLYSSLQLGNCPPEILMERSGERFLRIDYLSDPPIAQDDSTPQDAPSA